MRDFQCISVRVLPWSDRTYYHPKTVVNLINKGPVSQNVWGALFTWVVSAQMGDTRPPAMLLSLRPLLYCLLLHCQNAIESSALVTGIYNHYFTGCLLIYLLTLTLPHVNEVSSICLYLTGCCRLTKTTQCTQGNISEANCFTDFFISLSSFGYKAPDTEIQLHNAVLGHMLNWHKPLLWMNIIPNQILPHCLLSFLCFPH